MVILAGRERFFCTGMDFAEATQATGPSHPLAGEEYMALLKRFTSCGKIIIAKVEGTVLAGGMGLVAASGFGSGNTTEQLCLAGGFV